MLRAVHPLSEGLIEHLKINVKYRELAKGDYLLKADHYCRDIHFIDQGLLRCFYRTEQADISSWFMKDGDVIVSVESFFFKGSRAMNGYRPWKIAVCITSAMKSYIISITSSPNLISSPANY